MFNTMIHSSAAEMRQVFVSHDAIPDSLRPDYSEIIAAGAALGRLIAIMAGVNHIDLEAAAKAISLS